MFFFHVHSNVAVMFFLIVKINNEVIIKYGTI